MSQSHQFGSSTNFRISSTPISGTLPFTVKLFVIATDTVLTWLIDGDQFWRWSALSMATCPCYWEASSSRYRNTDRSQQIVFTQVHDTAHHIGGSANQVLCVFDVKHNSKWLTGVPRIDLRVNDTRESGFAQPVILVSLGYHHRLNFVTNQSRCGRRQGRLIERNWIGLEATTTTTAKNGQSSTCFLQAYGPRCASQTKQAFMIAP